MTHTPEPSAGPAPSAAPSAAPSTAAATGSAVDLGPVLRAVSRVRLRLRAQAAARHLFYGLLVAAAGLLAGVVLLKLRVLSLPQLRLVGLGGAVLSGLLALVGALRRIEPLQVAARIDKSHRLHDRLASALEFQREARRPAAKADQGPSAAMSALRLLAMQDAVRVAEGVVPAVAAPWQRPPYLLPIFILLGLAALLALVRLPHGKSALPTGETKPTAASDAPRLVVEPELLAPEKDEILRQLAEAERQGDAATAAILREMLKLLEQAERGELTRQQAFDKLSELEQRLMEGKEGTLEDLKQKLRKAGSELGESKLAKDVGQALVKEDLEKAQKELKRLAEQALQRQKGDSAQKDKSDLAKAMDAAARALSGKDDKAQKDLKREDPQDPSKQKDQWQDKSQAEKDRKEREELKRKLDELRAEERRLKERLEKNPNDEQAKQRLEQLQREMEETERRLKEKEEARKAEERTQRMQDLRDEERRLKKKLEQNPNDEETQRQLKKTQREMEKLEQEQRERDEARRELEQLEKDMQRAAEELRNQLEKMTPEQRKALEQLQKDLSRMQDEIKKLQKQKQGRGQAQMALGSLKTVLRRIARSTMGPGGGQQGQGQGQGQGQQGKSGAMRDFLQRANGKGGQGEEVLVEGEGGKDGEKMLILGQGGDQTVILPGLGGQGAGQRGQGQKEPGQDGPGGGKGGDGAGTQHDPNLSGDPTQISGNRKLTKVTGKEGAGPTRSETILGAAEKGFATSAYRRVYGDYTAVSEQVMSKQRVPPGYRFYVKRYFQMIKPRDR